MIRSTRRAVWRFRIFWNREPWRKAVPRERFAVVRNGREYWRGPYHIHGAVFSPVEKQAYCFGTSEAANAAIIGCDLSKRYHGWKPCVLEVVKVN